MSREIKDFIVKICDELCQRGQEVSDVNFVPWKAAMDFSFKEIVPDKMVEFSVSVRDMNEDEK